MTRPTVLVMEAQAKAALPVIESMAKAGVRVAAGSEKRIATGFYCRGTRERHVYPSPRYHKAAFQEWLIALLKRGRIELVFPLGHYGAPAVCEIQDEIRKHALIPIPPRETFWAAYAKIPTMKTALAAGVPIPASWFPNDMAGGLEEAISQIKNWPVLIKPSVGVGARGITWCYGAEDVRRHFPRIEAEQGACYLQDFVPPGGMQYKVDMIVGAQQQLLAGVVYGKTRMYPPNGGSSVLNYSADRPDIIELARRVLVQLGWVGFCDFDFVDDPRDGTAKLMEINPRFPESFRAATCVGIDFPKMLYDLAHGREVKPALDYPKGRFTRFLPGDIMWFLRVNNAQRFGTWPSWFSFFDSRTHYQISMFSDPGQMIGYLLENLALLFDRKTLRERLRLGSGRSDMSR